MRELYTIELMVLAKELKSAEGFYIDQFYELDKGKFRLKLSRKGEKANIRCIVPYSINRAESIEIKETATNFSIAVRKRIAGTKIKLIEQLNCDRIIRFLLEKSNTELNMVFEMFGKGNLVIADKDMKIQLAYKAHNFKDRSVRPRAIYAYPKNTSIDICANSKEELKKEMDSIIEMKGDGLLLNHLTKRIGIGKMYIEEAMVRSDIATDSKIKDIPAKDYKELINNINRIIEECTDSKSRKHFVYLHGSNPVNFALCNITKYSTLEKKEFQSLESLLEYTSDFIKEENAQNPELERISTSIEKQRKILDGIENEINACRDSGNYIMSHMGEINAMIERARSSKKISIGELQEISCMVEVLGIDMKTKSIKIRTKE